MNMERKDIEKFDDDCGFLAGLGREIRSSDGQIFRHAVPYRTSQERSEAMLALDAWEQTVRNDQAGKGGGR